ncbi:MAG TPA: alkaline phosphatase family protein, partial [Sphingomonadaceae bacterium]|nr:alkaline phosphatase family protein [Sphingomonadaceae bacterium]
AVAADLLTRRTITTRKLDDLKQDVLAQRLPEVSWIVAPAAMSEHPGASTPLQGGDYTAQVLDALTANPEVWARTVLLVNFDENDGLFDHMPPPAPPARVSGHLVGDTTIPADDEYHTHSQSADDAVYLDRPYGLGPRVPLYVISPWSKGGHVASEVFDHTSILRFLEARFGVHEPNISAWRRAVCGDLTSCFDFGAPDTVDFMATLPATADLSERASALEEIPPPLPAQVAAPVQETGLRRRRATPYRLDARLVGKPVGHSLLFVNNSAERAAVFHVYDVNRLDDVPARYTVGAGQELAHPLPGLGEKVDIFILGPNGFHRRLTGRSDVFSVSVIQEAVSPVALSLTNLSSMSQSITMTDRAYGAPARVIALAGGETRRIPLDLAESHGWYDRLFTAGGQSWRVAGHVENGEVSYSDPAAGGPGPLRLESAEQAMRP